ncbi:MAG TPA: pyridoxamine 5'-phosphate oxidase family protein [Candidatus Krumholzibacteria bacterium]|nr:pyridoxamine 5'-phosphate oxidase family protein [Candidatus Krumholzibacteria bacterium]
MRREELQSADPALFAELAAAVEVGELALVTADGTPRVIPLNFAALGETVYFHGALAGEKHDLCRDGGAPCSFAMTRPYSMIPSYWTAPRYACPATHFFKSVEIRGRCDLVAEPAEKAAALQALMEKYQPEGAFDPITPEDPVYAKALAGVGVFRVRGAWTGKVKFGVNETPARRRHWAAKLRERGAPRDLETALEIEKTLEDTP